LIAHPLFFLSRLKKQKRNPFACRYPAIRGTFAVAIGYLAHIEPLGTLQWNRHDALLGLLFAIPIALVDAFVMLPSWDPPQTTRTMRMMVPKEMADKLAAKRGGVVKSLRPTSSTFQAPGSSTKILSSSEDAAVRQESTTATATAVQEPPSTPSSGSQDGMSAETLDEAMIEMERIVLVRGDQHPFRDALYRDQRERVLNNVGRVLSPPAETVLLLLVHISEEMLYRGIILTLAVKWTTDRMYEAGADDVVKVFGGLEVATPTASSILAATGITFAAVGLLVQRELFPLRLLKAAREKFQEGKKEGGHDGGGHEIDAPVEQQAKMAEMLERVRRTVIEQQRWGATVTAVLEFVQWSTLSASYLVTGNILAPMVGSAAVDAVFSVYQRVKVKELLKARAKETEQMNLQFEDTKAILDSIKERKKGKLRHLTKTEELSQRPSSSSVNIADEPEESQKSKEEE